MPPSFVLTRLTLTDFRNYASLRLDPGPAMVVLTGPNGAGKTNLIEAISLLSPGRGLRGAPKASRMRVFNWPKRKTWTNIADPCGDTIRSRRPGAQYRPGGRIECENCVKQ